MNQPTLLLIDLKELTIVGRHLLPQLAQTYSEVAQLVGTTAFSQDQMFKVPGSTEFSSLAAPI